ncbi:MAG TPA: chloramphenicol phosphotransferase [Dehalococcoidia bacterium]|nr:chloramphenicol phosphotransferase [Dehalococcoidia bacterium]
MRDVAGYGHVVILNGPPRSGKSSIAAAIQASSSEIWMNLGVDLYMQATPRRLQPGIGLRPGEEAHPVYPLVPRLYVALYEAIAAIARSGLSVAVDAVHHDRAVLADCARRLGRLHALLVGVHCPLDEIMRRRIATWGPDDRVTPDEPVPEPVRRWQAAVHAGWPYDLELDTSKMTPDECAAAILARLAAGPGSALAKLRAETA